MFSTSAALAADFCESPILLMTGVPHQISTATARHRYFITAIDYTTGALRFRRFSAFAVAKENPSRHQVEARKDEADGRANDPRTLKIYQR